MEGASGEEGGRSRRTRLQFQQPWCCFPDTLWMPALAQVRRPGAAAPLAPSAEVRKWSRWTEATFWGAQGPRQSIAGADPTDASLTNALHVI